MGKRRNGQTDIHRDRQMKIWTYRETVQQTDREREIYRETEKWRDQQRRHRVRHAERYFPIQTEC